ncbi:MAG: NAD(P)-binding domain-containing protein [Balneolales bacterium]
MSILVGIIGFGTVGNVLAKIFKNSGIQFGVYDVLFDNPAHKERLLKKAVEIDAPVMDLSELCKQHTYIISTVTTQVAGQVAKKTLPYLKSHHVYIDCNSTSPGIKINIKDTILAGEAEFVEGVILNAVNPGDSTLSIITGGEKGDEVAVFFEKCGMKVRFYSEEVGKASMFKMLRSIFSKGVEVLLLEMMVAAKKAGIDQDLWNEISSFMDSKPFKEIGETWMRSHGTAYERRMHEMEQVITTMNELDVSPILTKATLQYFEQSKSFNLISSFATPPSSADEVVHQLAERVDEQKK